MFRLPRRVLAAVDEEIALRAQFPQRPGAGAGVRREPFQPAFQFPRLQARTVQIPLDPGNCPRDLPAAPLDNRQFVAGLLHANPCFGRCLPARCQLRFT